MSAKKILFLDTVHPCLQKELEAMGYTCDFKIKEGRAEVEKIIHQYSGVVLRSRISMDKRLLSRAKNLEFIARSGSGMESIDVAYAQKKGIYCFNSPEGNRDAVAEHALGMLLGLFNNINRADREIRAGEWNREKNRGVEFNGKTVGIIGFGNTGSAFARLLEGFDVKILAYDKYKNLRKTNFYEFTNKKKETGKIFKATMKDLFKEADVLSLHIPLTAETKYLVNDSFIKKFKKNFFLINTSRGPVVKTDDLVKNLKSGKILGACLDVIEYEESSFEKAGSRKAEVRRQNEEETRVDSFEYLKKSEKVILTPHIAGWTVESYRKLSQVLAEKIKAELHPEV